MGDLGQWWQDNWFNAVSLAVGVVGVLLAIVIPILQRKPKTLDYEVRNKLPLLSRYAKSASRGLSAPLTVHHGSERIADPYLLTVRIRNTGKRAIVQSDYDQQIEVHCAGQQPFDGFVSAAKPQGLDPIRESGRSDPEVLTMKPRLLNAGDWFDLQLLSDGDPGMVTVTARFTDQSRPMRMITDPTQAPIGTRSFYLCLIGYAALIAYSIIFRDGRDSPADDVLLIVIASLAIPFVIQYWYAVARMIAYNLRRLRDTR